MAIKHIINITNFINSPLLVKFPSIDTAPDILFNNAMHNKSLFNNKYMTHINNNLIHSIFI